MDRSFLKTLGLPENHSGVFSDQWLEGAGGSLTSHSPIDGSALGTVTCGSLEDYEAVINSTHQAFLEWRNWPAP